MKPASVREITEKMVKRLVKQFRPDRIILFGSHVRGEAGPDSDVDLLMVMPLRLSKHKTQIKARMALLNFPIAKDVIISTPEEFSWRKDVVGTIEYPASREGKVLYARS